MSISPRQRHTLQRLFSDDDPRERGAKITKTLEVLEVDEIWFR